MAAIQARSAHTKSAFVTHPTESEKQLENSGNSKPSAVFTASINGSHTGEASERQPLGLRLAFSRKSDCGIPPPLVEYRSGGTVCLFTDYCPHLGASHWFQPLNRRNDPHRHWSPPNPRPCKAHAARPLALASAAEQPPGQSAHTARLAQAGRMGQVVCKNTKGLLNYCKREVSQC